MKKLLLSIIAAGIALTACSQKEEPKNYQFPSGGSPATGMPSQSMDQEKMLKEALAKDPKNVDAWISLGNMMMDGGRAAEAVEAYGKALEINPKNVDVRVDMGTCYRSMGKPDLAVKEYRKAIEINPSHLNAYKNLGVVLSSDLKDNAQATKAFEKYLQLAPNAPDAAQIKQVIESLRKSK